MVPSGRETLAWRYADDGNDAHCYSRITEWKTGRLVGKGERRTIPALIRAKARHVERSTLLAVVSTIRQTAGLPDVPNTLPDSVERFAHEACGHGVVMLD